MLLYLVKYSRPDIANAVRELSKALDSPSPGAFNPFLSDGVFLVYLPSNVCKLVY